MPRVDFYILDSSHSVGRLQFACRLTEKAYRLRHKVFILVESAEQQAHLDKLLWTFRAESFIPHGVKRAENREVLQPVVIGLDLDTNIKFDVFINLDCTRDIVPEIFDRIIEIIDEDEMIRESGRHRYRQYQTRGDTLSTHKIQV